MIVSETAGGSAYTPCPPGSYMARCVRLLDLGTVTTDYQGEAKTAHKCLLAFEVLDPETRRDDGAPFVLSKRYTLSLHEKAALRKELASWRGRDFTPEELKGFDLRNILGQPCFVSVVETTKGDRTYSNIASIMKAPKGMPVPESVEPLLYWSMSDTAPNWEAFALLHPKLVEQIEQTPEFKRLTPPKRIAVTSQPAMPAQTAQNAPGRAAAAQAIPAPAQARQTAPAPSYESASGFEDMDSDIPF